MESNRVQVWMDREQFSRLLALFWAKDATQRLTALAEYEHETGPFVDLLAALEEANSNNANSTPAAGEG